MEVMKIMLQGHRLVLNVFACVLVINGYAGHGLSAPLSASASIALVGEGTPDSTLAPAPAAQPNGTGLLPPLALPSISSLELPISPPAPPISSPELPISPPAPPISPAAPPQVVNGPVSSPQQNPPLTSPPDLSVPHPTIPRVGEGTPNHVPKGKEFSTAAPAPASQENGTGLHPPPALPPISSPPPPQVVKGPMPSPQPSPTTIPPRHLSVPPPTMEEPPPAIAPSPPFSENSTHSAHPPLLAHVPAPITSPSRSSPPTQQAGELPVPGTMPPNSHQAKAPENNARPSPIAPVSNMPAPKKMPQGPPPSHSVLPEPPAIPPDMPSPPIFPGTSPPMKSILPDEPPSSPPEANKVPTPRPPTSIKRKRAMIPVAAPPNRTAKRDAPVSRSPKEAPHYQHPARKTNYRRNPPPPLNEGSSTHASPIVSPLPPSHNQGSPASAPPPPRPPSWHSRTIAPKMSPSGKSSTRNRKISHPPLPALPPPPPHKGCGPMTCTEPYTEGPPEAPCICVFPMQVGLRLGVELYTFFPLVTELAAEISRGVFMKPSQVRIMGANAANENSGKTIVLINLVPLRERFDDHTAYSTFQRFWHKQVTINTSFFGEYDVLYVRYPGLPPSPPLPPSMVGSIDNPGQGNNARTTQPLGVDIKQKPKHGVSGSIIAIIVLSATAAVILFSAIVWFIFFKRREVVSESEPTSPTTAPTLLKPSGIPASKVGSRHPSSASPSLSSNIAAYAGSAKTFSSIDVEVATDHFNEARILGEGGFGRVYSGILEDGLKVAVKVLKRDDQHRDREFMAEVEMLSRLHHRNLVKLVGICIEDRARSLVYELIPNGSVESHLHGIDRETDPLDWSARLKIALGAARALAYLHEDSNPPVIHRDFKSSNILLEDDFTPKVSDFGLARAALDEESRHISTHVMGTFGYVAPEYAMTGHLLVKSDVYSYGVVLLELLTGRRPIDMSQPGQENLVSWARPLLANREGLELIVDPSLGPDFPFNSLAKVAAIASMCVQPEVSHRPFMGEIVQALKLICNECDGMDDTESIDTDIADSPRSPRLPDPLLAETPVSSYDYRISVGRNHSISELLSSSVKYPESFRRHSSSGPVGMAKAKGLWQKMRGLPGGSISDHRVLPRLWQHGSH